MQEQLDRIEAKLDAHLQQSEHRLTKLESQAGFAKWSLGTLGTLLLFVANKLWGGS